MDKFVKLLFLGAILTIEFLATTTTVHIELIENIWDKANHFTAFFVLYLLLTLSFLNMKIYTKIIWLLLFGIQIELVQHFIEGRFFSLMDVVADFIGIVIGINAYKLYEKLLK